MSDPVTASKSARETLARALAALQSDPAIPPQLAAIAEPVSSAMGALFEIERSRGGSLTTSGPIALDFVRRSLALLQQEPSSHPAVQMALEAVAASLSLVHSIATAPRSALPGGDSRAAMSPAWQQAPGRAVAPTPATAVQARNPAAYIATPYTATPQREPPRAAPISTATAPMAGAMPPPRPGKSPEQPATGAADGRQPARAFPDPQVAGAVHAPMPAAFAAQGAAAPPAHAGAILSGHAAPAAPTGVFLGAAAAAAQGAQFAGHVPQGGPPMLDGASGLAPQGLQAVQPELRAGPPHAAAPAYGQQGAGQADFACAPPFLSPPSELAGAQKRPGPPPGGAGGLVRVEAALGAHSESNFYKGLTGSDVIEHGGIFVSTYRVLPVGTNVALHVALPGGYEFDAIGIVRWVREPNDGEKCGFGAQLVQLSAEARQLVYRYVRNREPLFHDDM